MRQGRRMPAGSAEPVRIGAEQELCLWRGDERLDFRNLISDVAGHIAALDPGDPQARRLPSGGQLTADGWRWEAQLASPPVPVGADAAAQVDAVLRAERTDLRELTKKRGVTRVTGSSTHVIVSVPDGEAVALGRAFLDSCVLGLAAITEPAKSHGVVVRPGRGRLEVGVEYVEGRRLEAALVFLAACVHGLGQDSSPTASRSADAVASGDPSDWFIAPEHLRGLDALDDVWPWARCWCRDLGLDPAPVDELLASRREREAVDECTFAGPKFIHRQATPISRRTRPNGVQAQTEWLTWDHVVWLFRAPSGEECRAVVRTHDEARFLADLDDGQLDARLKRMLRRRLTHRRLLVNAELGDGGLFHEVLPEALVPAERRKDGSLPRVSRREARRALRESARARVTRLPRPSAGAPSTESPPIPRPRPSAQ